MKLSIVVPVYNVERYIAGCLDSLLQQDMDPKDYEIVVVNDSTPDSSRRIAEGIAASHANMRIVDQVPNQGLGAARNRGIDEARGEYILFLDSDDSFLPNVIGGIVEAMERDVLDMLAYRYRLVDEQGADLGGGPEAASTTPVAGSLYLRQNHWAIMVHQYAYRTEFLRENHLRMIARNRHEDEEFTPRAICLARRIRHYPVDVYLYLQRASGSVMSTPFGVHDMKAYAEGMGSLRRFADSIAHNEPQAADYLRRRAYGMARDHTVRNLHENHMNDMAWWRELKRNGLIPMPSDLELWRERDLWRINHFPRLFFLRKRRRMRREPEKFRLG